LRALSVVFAVAAATLMVVAIAGMVTGRPGARAGLLVRVAALACFVAAVVLNVASH
jgi:hypothetical protein